MAISNEHAAAQASRGRSSQRRGIALVSVMVAILLLSTGVMAIAAANASRIRSQSQSSTRGTALNIARTYLEDVRARNPWTLASEAVVRTDAAGVVTPGGAFTRELIVTVERANLLRLEVVVTGPGATPIRLLTNAYRSGAMTPIL
jgi:Tfp pilus assembly protein PilV